MADLSEAMALRFAALAMNCVQREYPNKIAHAMNSDADVRPPRELTPAFFGCYDWHSAVHSHWCLVRLSRLFPNAEFAVQAQRVLEKQLTNTNIAGEVGYLSATGRESFERPYGLAWLLQLAAELWEWESEEAKKWLAALAPLEKLAKNRLAVWIQKLSHPVRAGEHSNTAFAMGLMLDYARSVRDDDFRKLLEERAKSFYLKDVGCPSGYEPSGEDFVSPCLAEADIMRRILQREEFGHWLTSFLPELRFDHTEVRDTSDGKIGHLVGLDLSRAWMLAGIASGLESGDARCGQLLKMADDFRMQGINNIDDRRYHGSHWLGTFAVYLLSGRGLN